MLRYRYVFRVEMLRYRHIFRVEMLRYRYVVRVDILRYRHVFRVEMLRYRHVFRVEMLRYCYVFRVKICFPADGEPGVLGVYIYIYIYGMSSFPLTNSYFSRWLKPPTSYVRPKFQVYVREYPNEIWPNIWYTSILGSHAHWFSTISNCFWGLICKFAHARIYPQSIFIGKTSFEIVNNEM